MENIQSIANQTPIEIALGYEVFFINEENPKCGRPTQDYKLTAHFAKKLSMQQKNKRGEEARDYFASVENKAKDMVLLLKEASNNPMKLLELHYEALKEVDKKVDKVSKDVKNVKEEMRVIKDDLPLLPLEAYEIEKAVRKKAYKS